MNDGSFISFVHSINEMQATTNFVLTDKAKEELITSEFFKLWIQSMYNKVMSEVYFTPTMISDLMDICVKNRLAYKDLSLLECAPIIFSCLESHKSEQEIFQLRQNKYFVASVIKCHHLLFPG